jgi:hypothetical protein
VIGKVSNDWPRFRVTTFALDHSTLSSISCTRIGCAVKHIGIESNSIVSTDVASVESVTAAQLRITMVLMQRPTRDPEHGPSIPLMVIRACPRLRMRQRNTGDHAVQPYGGQNGS